MADEMEEIIGEFITEAEESLDRIDPLFIELETRGQDKDLLNEIFRSMHTIKGAAGFLGFQSIVDVSHRAENIMKKLRDGEISISKPIVDTILKAVDTLRILLRHIKLKDGIVEDLSDILGELDRALLDGQTITDPKIEQNPGNARGANETFAITAPKQEKIVSQKEISGVPDKGQDTSLNKDSIQTLRISAERIDKVMDLTGEIVLARNRLSNISSYLEEKYPDDHYVSGLLDTVSFLNLVVTDIQLAVMKMRMQPLKKVFGKFPRLVRDLSNNIGKDVELFISGEDTEVDRSVIEHIGDPLVHIIRNSIDHGIESREERLKKGKPSKGLLSISAYQQGNQIVIEISDDGKGLDLEKIKNKALQRHLITDEEAKRMKEEDIINLIFLPGFSTADVATELSGRGVGMDVVKTNISRLNGYIEVSTKRDIGTTFKISIPLTLAIINALMVRTGDWQYAVPLAPVEEILKVHKREIKNISGQNALVVRGKVCPIFELSDLLENETVGDREHRYLLVIAIGERRFCLAVDELLGQEEVVIKSINGVDTNASYTVGATITGEGKVVLILDLAGIARAIKATG